MSPRGDGKGKGKSKGKGGGKTAAPAWYTPRTLRGTRKVCPHWKTRGCRNTPRSCNFKHSNSVGRSPRTGSGKRNISASGKSRRFTPGGRTRIQGRSRSPTPRTLKARQEGRRRTGYTPRQGKGTAYAASVDTSAEYCHCACPTTRPDNPAVCINCELWLPEQPTSYTEPAVEVQQ